VSPAGRLIPRQYSYPPKHASGDILSFPLVRDYPDHQLFPNIELVFGQTTEWSRSQQLFPPLLIWETPEKGKREKREKFLSS
jgi:hypothetical protein